MYFAEVVLFGSFDTEIFERTAQTHKQFAVFAVYRRERLGKIGGDDNAVFLNSKKPRLRVVY